MPKFVFFTDLDGTFLDFETYSFEEAKPGLQKIKQTGNSLVFCTSKTKAEMEEYEQTLQLNEPFVVENGGGVYIPKGYFGHEIKGTAPEGKYLVLRIGTNSKELRAVVDALAEELEIVPLHRMSTKQFAEDTGLTEEQAAKAKDRHFTASFKNKSPGIAEKARQFVEKRGYTLSVGRRFCAVMKGNDKGKAVQKLMPHYRKEFGKVVSVGLGDSENDFGMLRACDKAFLVAKAGGVYSSDEFPKAPGSGPAGWSKAVLQVLRGKQARKKGLK